MGDMGEAYKCRKIMNFRVCQALKVFQSSDKSFRDIRSFLCVPEIVHSYQ